MDPARLRPRRGRWPEHSAAVVLVLAVHGVLVLCLSRVAAPSITARNDTDAPRMMLEFIARAQPPTKAQTPPAPLQIRPIAATRSGSAIRAAPSQRAQTPNSTVLQPPAAHAAEGRSGLDNASATAGNSTQPLNLALPAAVVAPAAITRTLMQRTAPVDYQTTRFANAWTPDGGEIQQTWAFRSKLAGAALSMTGALERPCTQRERDQRLQKCFGKQYQGDVSLPTLPGN
ncbi:hypothetical protein ACU10_00340 [Xanthomonas oryzae pv. oryzicola]|nr:hypothetical protein ACU13_00340 [Xanthomonas oryzae pv. oryzicola]AKN95490.1 hypothetical protein ACU10_00340 [Xanthomonas oryzae pv. oryzicola]AKO10717.1 hypothetical protein ACU14_00340 [Xanthomonas oryzae pv. oryzicola]AKO14451.1 hypothetical protein ACU12_00340 [Xanthomonas oryzae pv. oryzicola]